MATLIKIQVGKTFYHVDSEILPPVRATIVAHKHLYDGGKYPELEVISHDWRLEEPADAGGNAILSVTVRTRILIT